ncbi:MAG TPA: SRPBCC domain-containing protein [Actinopolymorphaceae bacterium]
MSERRKVEKRIRLEATPEEVWELISTGPGLSAWFVPHDFDDAAEGFADFGGGNTQAGRVLELDPGKRVVFGAPENEDGEVPMALEFLVEGRDGGGTVLRLVQSGFLGEDWEAEYHSKGWDLFLHNLSTYVTHFAGLPATGVVATVFTSADGATVWERFFDALGLRSEVAVGDAVDTGEPLGTAETLDAREAGTLAPALPEAISGVVDVTARGVLGIRSDHALYRFVGEGADGFGMVSLTHYIYGVDLDRAERTAAWQAWLDGLFPRS